MAQDNASIVRGFVDEVITNGNIEAAAHYVWEDVVEQVPLPGQGPGLDGLKDILRAMRSGFPDIVFSIQEQVAEHDKVASRFEWTGTHNGEFLGIPATGRPVRRGSRIPALRPVQNSRTLADFLLPIRLRCGALVIMRRFQRECSRYYSPSPPIQIGDCALPSIMTAIAPKVLVVDI
jgi:predicted ester cyclase